MIPKRVDISDRPVVIDLRFRLGDWGDGQGPSGDPCRSQESIDINRKVDTKHTEIIADSMA
ncbi:MAG: hypothetical protein KAG53_05430 [Endozoicomonadaceae bacterium]|nr:hypothetical protein [Endozoicomonadaceae bacterium]